MLLYFLSVLVMASSIASFVINMGMADTERALITLSSAALFLLGVYGMGAWARRKARENSEAA